jgi:ABC-type Zn uptake system ZnuABC Zn-binding protein ZnuA
MKCRVLFLAAVAALAASASRPVAAASREPLRVVTSIPPLAMLAAELGGDRVLAHSLLAAGADAHTYEPRPSDAAALQDADLVIALGSSIDDWLGEAVRPRPGTLVVLLDAADEDHGRDLEAEHAAEGHRHLDDHGRDPHVWLDPVWVRDRAVAPLHRALATADPDGAARYGVRARAMAEDLSNLEDEIRGLLARATTRHILAWHPAWERFARRFDLHSVAGVEESGGREPSLRSMVAAIRAGRAAGVMAVLVEPQEDARHARVLADELAVPVVTVDPLGSAWSGDRATYRTLMLFNAQAFARALGVVKRADDEAEDAPPTCRGPSFGSP